MYSVFALLLLALTVSPSHLLCAACLSITQGEIVMRSATDEAGRVMKPPLINFAQVPVQVIQQPKPLSPALGIRV